MSYKLWVQLRVASEVFAFNDSLGLIVLKALSHKRIFFLIVSHNTNMQHFSPLYRFARSIESLWHYHGGHGCEDEAYCPSPFAEIRYEQYSNVKNVLAAPYMHSLSQNLASPCQLWCQVGQLNPLLLGSTAAEVEKGCKSHGANTSSGLWHPRPLSMFCISACAHSRSCAETGSHNQPGLIKQRPWFSGEHVADVWGGSHQPTANLWQPLKLNSDHSCSQVLVQSLHMYLDFIVRN